MDKMLWEAMTNLMSIILTQTNFIVEAAQEGADGADKAAAYRLKLLRSIGEDLVDAADQMMSKLDGSDGSPDDVESELDDLCEQFSKFLSKTAREAGWDMG